MQKIDNSQDILKPYKSGTLISFEGLEGAGKSTQIKMLENYLSTNGDLFETLREPGGTVLGEKLREAMLSSTHKVHPYAQACLFASSRSQLLFEKVLPELDKGHIVILDRYIDSSFAYQGIAGGLGIDTIIKLHSEFPLTVMPNLTFYLDISVETSISRMKSRGEDDDFFESKGQEFFKSLQSGYYKAIERFPERIIKIDGTKDPEHIFDEILSHLKKAIN